MIAWFPCIDKSNITLNVCILRLFTVMAAHICTNRGEGEGGSLSLFTVMMMHICTHTDHTECNQPVSRYLSVSYKFADNVKSHTIAPYENICGFTVV